MGGRGPGRCPSAPTSSTPPAWSTGRGPCARRDGMVAGHAAPLKPCPVPVWRNVCCFLLFFGMALFVGFQRERWAQQVGTALLVAYGSHKGAIPSCGIWDVRLASHETAPGFRKGPTAYQSRGTPQARRVLLPDILTHLKRVPTPKKPEARSPIFQVTLSWWSGLVVWIRIRTPCFLQRSGKPRPGFQPTKPNPPKRKTEGRRPEAPILTAQRDF